MESNSTDLNYTLRNDSWNPAESTKIVTGPNWDDFRTDIKWVFLLHSYGFACSFLVLAFFSFFSILNIRSLITNRPYMSTVNIFLCILGATRSASLFIDPYNLRTMLPRAIGSVLWDCGLPCVLSAFSLVQLAMLQLTQLRIGPDFIKSKSSLTLVITLHFTCVIATDISLTVNPQLYVMKYIVDVVFICWGIMICGTFLYACRRALIVLSNMPAAMLERDLEVQHKGIMQLAMLAPYNNLASSVAAALVPTLLAPKMMQQVRQNQAQEASFSTPIKTAEPAKSCIAKQGISKQNSEATDGINSDNDETKGFLDVKEKRTKKLSWGSEQKNSISGSFKKDKSVKNKSTSEEDVEESCANTTLLPPAKQGDLTLQTILNHIAYVNRASGGPCELGSTGLTRKNQLTVVLRLSIVTAFLCFGLLLTQVILLFVPPGVFLCGARSWLGFQTSCRSLELIMSWAMANMTKQPVSSNRSLHYPVAAPSKGLFM